MWIAVVSAHSNQPPQYGSNPHWVIHWHYLVKSLIIPSTSSSQLEEDDVDRNASANAGATFTLGLPSPGKTSPIRGHTMKEFEDQLSQLKKEHFSLKLRINFLEERMGHMSTDDKEDPVKKNIEIKVVSLVSNPQQSWRTDWIAS